MPPVVAFAAGAAAAIGGTAPIVLGGAAVTSSFAAGAFAVQSIAAFATTALGGVLINAALGFAVNAILAAFNKVPQPKAGDLQSNFLLGDAPRIWAMGPVRLGGGTIFAEGLDGTLYKLVAHADAEATGEFGLWMNDIPVTLDGSNYVTEDDFRSDGDAFYRLYMRAGTAAQAASSVMRADWPTDWPATAVGAGVADTLLKLDPVSPSDRQKILRHRGILGLGEPDVTRGAWWGRCHDPRDPSSDADDPATWPASDGNPALIWAAHRMDVERFAMPAARIAWDLVAIAADICDESVLDRYGNAAPRWRCGIAINKSEESNIDAEDRILATMDAIRIEDENGLLGIAAGRYFEPSVTLTDDDVYAVQSGESDDGETRYTHFVAQYTEPAAQWKDALAAVWVDPDWFPGQPIRTTRLPVAAVWNHRQAVTLAKAAGQRANETNRLALVAGLRALRLRGQRFVRLTLASDPTLDGVYEIASRTKAMDGLTVTLGLIAVDATRWTLAAGEEGERPNTDFTLSNADAEIANIDAGDMNIQAASIVLSGGGRAARFVATFPAPRSDLVVQIQYRKKTTTVWVDMSVRSEDGAAQSGTVDDAAVYEFQWRVVSSASGDASDFASPLVEVTAVADQTAPGDLTSVSVSSPSAGQVDVAFVTPASDNYYAARIWRADYTAGYSGPYDFASDAVQVREETGLPGQADGWSNTGLSTGHYAYWLEPINGSGFAGTRDGPNTVDVA